MHPYPTNAAAAAPGFGARCVWGVISVCAVASSAAELQNLDGTIGRFLPSKFKDKVQQAMNQGIGSVFGKLKDGLGDKVALGGSDDIFSDRNYYVYRRPGDKTQAYKRLEDLGANDFADPLGTGSFMSAEVRTAFCVSSH